MINDNNPDGPEVTVVVIEIESKSIIDPEPFQQLLTLSCGHTVINTHGNRRDRFDIGDTLRCRTCGLKK